MLYTVLPGLSLCMTLLKGNLSTEPIMNIAMDDSALNSLHYTKYLDAAMILINAAKQKKQDSVAGNEATALEATTDDWLLSAETGDDIEDFSGPIALEEEDVFDLSEATEAPDGEASVKSRCPKPIDCEELLLECGFTTSGVYRVWPRSRVNTWGDGGFDVYCDMETDGGGWTIIQRRDDFGTNSDFFFKEWQDYKYGFGHLSYDFWLGNEKIFALSNQKRTVLRFDLDDFEENKGFAIYDSFHINDESQGYKLHIGDYRGDIGDSFRGHDSTRFTTKDQDNDNSDRNCATVYKGGWWYNNCHTVNLNGLYLRGKHDSFADGLEWHSWRGFKYSLKRSEMKLRSSSFRIRNEADYVTVY